jgi:hypothetical protein
MDARVKPAHDEEEDVDCRVKPVNDESYLVSRARCGILYAASQNRDPGYNRKKPGPRHRFAKGYAARYVRGTELTLFASLQSSVRHGFAIV